MSLSVRVPVLCRLLLSSSSRPASSSSSASSPPTWTPRPTFSTSSSASSTSSTPSSCFSSLASSPFLVSSLVLWVSSSSSSTPSFRSPFSSPSLSPRPLPSSPRAPTQDTSPCAMTVALSSSRRLSSPPSWMPWVPPLVVKERLATRVPASKMMRTAGQVALPSPVLEVTAPPWLVAMARFLALPTTLASPASLATMDCLDTTLPSISTRSMVS